MNFAVKLFPVLIAYSCSSQAFKILVISPFPAKSHYILSQGIVKHLTRAGHEITLVTAYPNGNSSALFRTIDLSELHKYAKGDSLKTFINKKSVGEDISSMLKLMRVVTALTLENKDMQKLMSDPKEKFDLIIAEWMFNDVYAGLAAVFQCPFIWLSTFEPNWLILHLIDEFPNPTYTPDNLSCYVPPMCFIERVHELCIQFRGIMHKFFFASSIEREDYEKLIFPFVHKRGNAIASFDILRYNISLVLGNSHVSMGLALRLPQSYKPIGGYHIDKEVNPLPQDLQTIMDNAKNGVIYFSMGSNLKSATIPDKMKRDILNVFGRLKRTVIWKFEEDLPDRPRNVHIVKWAPQQSILSHRNCALFITHGGILSMTEAIHYAVPIIGIPVYGDQFNNVARAVKKGFAKFVQLSCNMASNLEEAVNEIIGDPSYTAKVKELSFIYHHRPMSPGDELVHWAEHVIHTKGALHLRSPALSVSWYQKLYLDLICIITTIIAILYMCIKQVIMNLTWAKEKAD